MTIEDYCSFEVAKLLKEKGFNEPCHATYDIAVTGGKPKFSEYEVLSFFPNGMRNTDDKYNMVISAPTLQMAMRWLREVHNIFIDIEFGVGGCYVWAIVDMSNNIVTNVDALMGFYEQACESAIKYCLENLV